MSRQKKKRRNRKEKETPTAKRSRRSSTLEQHKREGKTLLPPMLQQPLHLTSWVRDLLPDFLWIASVADSRGSAGHCHHVLDALDELMPPDSAVLDGRLSTFAEIPLERRGAALEILKQYDPPAVLPELAHALLLYPDCPARWLLAGSCQLDRTDPDIGLPYLKRLLRPLMDHRDVPATRLRMLPLARRTKHGRLMFHQRVETVSLLPRYPAGLTPEEQRRVESWTRATYNAMALLEPDDSAGRSWAQHFWRHGWSITPCEEAEQPFVPPPEHDEDDAGGPSLTAKPEPSTDQHEALRDLEATHEAALAALDRLSSELEILQARASMDLYDPTPDEVRLGLAARQLRLFRSFSEDPRLWSDDLAPLLVRSLAESRILVAWLLRRDDAELYARFKEYGLGKRKLFKLHLENWLDDNGGSTADGERLRELEREVNADVMEEFIRIDLGGNFAKTDLRKMAEEVGLKPVYVLIYQPLSTDAHGEWGTLLKFDFRHCANPLHRYHRRGAFVPWPAGIHKGWLGVAFELTRDAVCQVFQHYGLDARPAFEKFSNEVSPGNGVGPANE